MDDQMRPDIAAAWSKVNNKIGKKRDIRKLHEYLNSGETVLAITGGVVAGRNGLLVATDRRAMFVSEGIIRHSFEDFPYDRITSVTSSRGIMLGKIVIHGAGAARVVEQVDKGEAEAVAAIIRDRVDATTREPRQKQQQTSDNAAPQPVSPAVGIAAELRELASLRDAGVLTDKEFEQQKSRLLGR